MGVRFTLDDLKAKGFDSNGKRKANSSQFHIATRKEPGITPGSFFIPYEVPSKKNSKQIVPYETKSGRTAYKPIDSEVCRIYKKLTKTYYRVLAKDFLNQTSHLSYPLNIKFTFIRSTKRAFDYNNIGQMVQDLMVSNGWLPDDNYRYLKPFYGDVIIDSKRSGVIITIMDGKNL